MCEPTSIAIATAALGVASSLASYSAQTQQAKAQAYYQEQQAAEYNRVQNLNNKAIAQEYVEQSTAERMKQMQEQTAASDQEQKIQREAAQKQGTMLASTNASGGALNSLMADYQRQEANEKDSIRQQYEFNSANADMTINNYRNTAQNKISSQQRYIASPVSTPSFLSTALNIGSAVVSGYDKYNTLKYKQTTAGTKG